MAYNLVSQTSIKRLTMAVSKYINIFYVCNVHLHTSDRTNDDNKCHSFWMSVHIVKRDVIKINIYLLNPLTMGFAHLRFNCHILNFADPLVVCEQVTRVTEICLAIMF